jgi:hypothetical protein
MARHGKTEDRRAQAVASVHRAMAELEEWWGYVSISVANVNADGRDETYLLVTHTEDDPEDPDDGVDDEGSAV